MLRSWREVAAGYDVAADGYDTRHGDPASVARARILDEPLLAAARGARRVLEIGVGTGRLLAQVDAPEMIGVDVSAGMLAHAARRGLRVLRADAEALPFADGVFDAVLAAKGVFRYVAWDRAFAECARVLRPGGRLGVQQFAARAWRPFRAPHASAGVHELDDVASFVLAASAQGLRVLETRRYRPVRLGAGLLAIPAWTDRVMPLPLWQHVVIVFAKNGDGYVD